jgi:hypothetical protein
MVDVDWNTLCMAIQYPEGTPRMEDPRLEVAVEYLADYQHTLRDLFGGLPEDTKCDRICLPA